MKKRFETLLAHAERINAPKSARIFRLAIASLDYLGRRGRRTGAGGGPGAIAPKPSAKAPPKPEHAAPARSSKKKN